MPLNDLLDRLVNFTPTQLPVMSLYLNTQPDQHGRDNFDAFIRKEFKLRAAQFEAHTPAAESFARDVERINDYLRAELRPSANGVAVFACAGAADFFEAVQTEAPINEHQLFVTQQPQLFGLARLEDQYPPYVTLVADTNKARLYVFGLGETLEEHEVANPNVHRSMVGGWSQARYQRHIDNYHLHHAKEVVEELERLVREEKLSWVVLAGDEVIIPILRKQLSQEVDQRVIDVLRLDITTPEHEIRQASLAAVQAHDAAQDTARIAKLLDEGRGQHLATLGAHDTLLALVRGQVEELFIPAAPQTIRDDLKSTDQEFVPFTSETDAALRPLLLANELVRRAHSTAARVTFIEDAGLLAEHGGVGAKLRFGLQTAKPGV
jgi:peptide chain release factor subunit 1